jgi:hypothetical protein
VEVTGEMQWRLVGDGQSKRLVLRDDRGACHRAALCADPVAAPSEGVNLLQLAGKSSGSQVHMILLRRWIGGRR